MTLPWLFQSSFFSKTPGLHPDFTESWLPHYFKCLKLSEKYNTFTHKKKRVYFSLQNSPTFPNFHTESIKLPDLLCQESTTQNSICIPGIPWPVGTLKLWHITQLDPNKLLKHTHPHAHRDTVLMYYPWLLKEASLRSALHILIWFWRHIQQNKLPPAEVERALCKIDQIQVRA